MVINLYISYTLSPWLRNLYTDFTLNNWLFGSVNLTKNADSDKYEYNGYGIGLLLVQKFHLQMEVWQKVSLFLGQK